MKLLNAKAFKVLNSKAEPAIAIAVKSKEGYFTAAAPSGSSKGIREVKSYKYDLDTEIEYFNSKVSSTVRGFKFCQFNDFAGLEHNLSKVGGNTVIALEYALLKALAHQERKNIYEIINPRARRLPRLLGKAIGGGAHAAGKGDIQEYLFSPDASSLTTSAFINADIYHFISEKMAGLDKHFMYGRDAEGGWLTNLAVTDTLKLCGEAKWYAELKYKCHIDLGIDLAASQMFRKGKYFWNNYSSKKKALQLTSSGQLQLLTELMREYDLTYVEDPFEEGDFHSFSELSNIKNRKEICSDDLTCTNPTLLRTVIERRAATAVIVKPNQIGSLIKTKEFVDLAKRTGLKVVVSHRSGSFADPILSHLALAFEADFFKCGISGGERTTKINELIRLENSFGTVDSS